MGAPGPWWVQASGLCRDLPLRPSESHGSILGGDRDVRQGEEAVEAWGLGAPSSRLQGRVER